MAPRAIWSGSISFGLLNVPVKLYSAVSRKSVGFRELRASDSSRIRHKRVAEADDEEVPYEDIVKGYELGEGRYVVLTKEELAELDPAKTRTIDVTDFVSVADIDPIYFDHPYYLGPDKGGTKAYSLLVKAMQEAGKVAIARFVLRSKENLAAIRPLEGVLTMTTMRFADEVLSPDELGDVLGGEADGKAAKASAKEVEMATALIDSLSAEFEPTAYRDEYREKLLDLIERKASGEPVVVPEAPEAAPTAAPDLMAALEQSLAAVRRDRDEKPKKPARKSTAKRSSGAKKKTPAKSKS